MRVFQPYAGPALSERIVAVDNLTLAWRRVRANIQLSHRGRSAGVDRVTLHDFAADWPNQMAQLADDLRSGAYQPLPGRTVHIPKRDGGERAITILAIRDRVAQRAAQQVLDPVFDPQFLECSYGCRPGLGVPDALAQVARHAERGYTWVVDADLASYFDSLDQRLLLGFFRQRVNEVAVLQLVARWLAAGTHQTAETAPLAPDGPERSLVRRGGELLRQLLDGAHSPELAPPDRGRDYLAASWEQPVGDGWRPGPGAYDSWGRPAMGSASPINSLWTAFLLARPLLAGARRGLPYLQRPSAGRLLAAGGMAAGALAAYELALRWRERRPIGTIQGGAISPLLANIYLHPFDLALTSQGLRLVRFMDDFVIMCASRAEAEAALGLVERQLDTLRLRLNPAKTRIVDYAEGLEFLGQALAPRRRGPSLEQGLASFEEADQRLRAALREARAGVRKAGNSLRSQRKPGRRGPKQGGS